MSTAATDFNSINTFSPDPDEPQIDLGTYDPTASDKIYPADPRPGVHTMTFKLQTGEGYEHQPFEVVEKGPVDVTPRPKALRVNYKLSYTAQKKDGTEFERTLNFLSVDFYQTPKMKEKNIVSEGAKMLSALGYDVQNDGPFTQANVSAFLRAAEAQGKTLRVKTGLRYYDKAATVEYTTNPRKGNEKQQLWPKNEQGEWKLWFQNSEGKRVAGNATVVEFYKTK